MIIAKISDGFGNQLFMYACGYAAAKRLKTQLMLDTAYLDTNNLRSYELDNLNIRYDKFFSTEWLKVYLLKVLYRKLIHGWMKLRFQLFREKKEHVFDPHILSIKNNTYLFGYWQSEKYFKEYREDLLAMITPRYELSDGCRQYIQQIRTCRSVAVHIRRGDYVKAGICVDEIYYKKAFEEMERWEKEPVFFIFSDDISYARQMFLDSKRNIIYVQYKSANLTLDDFFIMKECRHHIIANSSFSWWAAWLNNNPDKIVVYPQMSATMGDYYPAEWHMIKTRFEANV